MGFLEYLNAMSADERERFAARCDSSVNRLKQIAYGNECASPSVCAAIDRESLGVISYRSVNDAWVKKGGHVYKPMDWDYVERKAIQSKLAPAA